MRLKMEKEHTTITYRDFKKLIKEQLNNALKDAPWDSAFIFENSSDVLDAWYKIFEDVVNTYLPLKQKRVKRKILPKWFTSEIKQRDKLLRNARQTKSANDWLKYKQARNRVSKLIRTTKETYFNNNNNNNNL